MVIHSTLVGADNHFPLGVTPYALELPDDTAGALNITDDSSAGAASGTVQYMRFNTSIIDRRILTGDSTVDIAWSHSGDGLIDFPNLHFRERSADESAVSGQVVVYSKDDGGTTQLFARDSGGTVHQLTPSGTSFSGLSDVNLSGVAQGDVLFYDGSDWVNLGPGTSGQYLQTQGAGANPQWAAASGGNTLDQAYDQGGAGAGRSITVDSSAVQLTAADRDTPALEFTGYIEPTTDAFRIGSPATATTLAARTIAVGRDTDATSTDSVIIGHQAAGQSGSSNVIIGYLASGDSSEVVAIGQGCSASALRSIAIGQGTQAQDTDTTAVGYQSEASQPSTTALGAGATANGNSSLAVGAYADTASFGSMVFGRQAVATAQNQLVLGSSFSVSEQVFFGRGVESSNATAVALQNNDIQAGTTDTASGQLTIRSGLSTGSAAGGTIVFQGSFAGSTGSTQNTHTTMLELDPDESVPVRVAQGGIRMPNTAWYVGVLTGSLGSNSLMLGNNSESSGTQSVAVGTNNTAGGNFSVVIGEGNTDSGQNQSVAVGEDITANGVNTIAIGSNTTTSGNNSVALGRLAQATTTSVAIGESCDASAAQDSFLLGSGLTSGSTDTVMIGRDGTSGAIDNVIAIGINADVSDATASDVIVIGFGAEGGASGSIVIGDGASGEDKNTPGSYVDDALVIGRGATVGTGTDVISIGRLATGDGNAFLALGDAADAGSTESIAIGPSATVGATSTAGIAIGHDTSVTGAGGVAIGSVGGTYGPPQATSGIALGKGVETTNGYAIGTDTRAYGSNAVAIGRLQNAGGTQSVSVGYSGSATGTFGLSLGRNCTNAFDRATAIGPNATTTATDQLMLHGTNGGVATLTSIRMNNGSLDSPTEIDFYVTDGSGNDVRGSDWAMHAGRGTGNARPGHFTIIGSEQGGSSGSTLATEYDVWDWIGYDDTEGGPWIRTRYSNPTTRVGHFTAETTSATSTGTIHTMDFSGWADAATMLAEAMVTAVDLSSGDTETWLIYARVTWDGSSSIVVETAQASQDSWTDLTSLGTNDVYWTENGSSLELVFDVSPSTPDLQWHATGRILHGADTP